MKEMILKLTLGLIIFFVHVLLLTLFLMLILCNLVVTYLIISHSFSIFMLIVLQLLYLNIPLLLLFLLVFYGLRCQTITSRLIAMKSTKVQTLGEVARRESDTG